MSRSMTTKLYQGIGAYSLGARRGDNGRGPLKILIVTGDTITSRILKVYPQTTIRGRGRRRIQSIPVLTRPSVSKILLKELGLQAALNLPLKRGC